MTRVNCDFFQRINFRVAHFRNLKIAILRHSMLTLIGSYANFETNARKALHGKDEAVFLAASHSTHNAEYLASFFYLL